MKALCLCHEVVCERKDTGAIKYQGPSPDEIALVEAAADVGFVLQNTCEETIELNFTNGKMQCDSYDSQEADQPIVQAEDIELEFEFERNRHGVHYGPGVHLFEIKRRMQFTSDRKRMSVLVRDPMDGNFKLFVKGADSTIEERLDPDANDGEMLRHARGFATDASKLGLRTLFIAMKLIDEKEVHDFFEKVEEAENCIQQREEMLENLYGELESHLVLLGATAVEDRL